MSVANDVAAWDRRAETAFTDAEACMWSDRGMLARHDRVAALLRESLSAGDTVYDHGCGTAHLRMRLPVSVNYVGWDTSPGMRARAARRKRVHIPDARPRGMPFEHVVVCGVYNLRHGWSQSMTTTEVFQLWNEHRPRRMIVTLRTATEDEAHLHYAPMWIASLAVSLSDRWMMDAVTLANEAIVVLAR